ncbi:hypothetical protein BGZ83_004621, partial [Gryganskiella cystojenkinii]
YGSSNDRTCGDGCWDDELSRIRYNDRQHILQQIEKIAQAVLPTRDTGDVDGLGVLLQDQILGNVKHPETQSTRSHASEQQNRHGRVIQSVGQGHKYK